MVTKATSDLKNMLSNVLNWGGGYPAIIGKSISIYSFRYYL